MTMHGFCLFVLLSATSAIQAQAAPAKESVDDLEKRVKALEEKIKLVQDQINELTKKQAELSAERSGLFEKQSRIAAEKWRIESKSHFVKGEIRGKLTGTIVIHPFAFKPKNKDAGKDTVTSWQIVVDKRRWEVRLPEKDKALLAAAEALINREVVIRGSVFCGMKLEAPIRLPSSFPIDPYGPGFTYLARPPEYVFGVFVESLQPPPMTPSNAKDKELQKRVEEVRDRIKMLSRKGDDITRRESYEAAGLQKTLEELEVQLQISRVQIRGKLVTKGAEIIINSARFLNSGFWPIDWKLNFGNNMELKALANKYEGKEVIITATITADPGVSPSMSVELLKLAEE